MKLTIIGFMFMLLAIGVAGNWVYNPFATVLSDVEPFEPIPHYPKDDPADYVYRSDLVFIPALNISYIQYNYVWLNASGHTPDTEEVRIFVKDGKVQHVSLRIHYQWIDVYNFTIEGTHVHIRFMPIYHTPYVSETSFISTSIQRMTPILIPLGIGVGLIYLDYKLVTISARAKVAKGMTKYSIRAKWNMIFGKTK
jgi:hypothetical protein